MSQPSPHHDFDGQAFARLVREHQSDLWRYVRLLGCEAAQADDLVQEAFVYLWRHPVQDRGPVALAAYLRKVARHLFIDLVRRKRIRPVFEDLESSELVWQEYSTQDGGRGYREALQLCLGRLGERANRAIGLFYHEDLSREQIGKELTMTPDGVKTLLRRARASLRDCITRSLST